MAHFFVIARTSDFDEVSIRGYTILGKKIAVVKKDDGSFYAIEAACKHQGADLTKGKIENGIAVCPRHQWEYDLETGECLNHESPPLRRFPLLIEENRISIAITWDEPQPREEGKPT